MERLTRGVIVGVEQANGTHQIKLVASPDDAHALLRAFGKPVFLCEDDPERLRKIAQSALEAVEAWRSGSYNEMNEAMARLNACVRPK